MNTIIRVPVSVAAVFALLCGSSLMPTQAMSQPIRTSYRISAGMAAEIVVAAVKACEELSMGATAIVLDADGVRQAQLRGDNSPIHALDSSFYKAYTALTLRSDTIDLVERHKTGPMPSALTKIPNLILSQGGVIIRYNGKIIGSIGVGGAQGNNIDDRCARAGLAQISDRLR